MPTEVEVLKETRDSITVRLKGTDGEIRLRRSRVFKTKEEALKSIKDINLFIVVHLIMDHLDIDFIRIIMKMNEKVHKKIKQYPLGGIFPVRQTH